MRAEGAPVADDRFHGPGVADGALGLAAIGWPGSGALAGTLGIGAAGLKIGEYQDATRSPESDLLQRGRGA